MPLTEGMPIVNIERAELVTEEDTPKTFVFDTASEADISPYLSNGQEEILRVKNKILAINKTEDIVVGYDLTLRNSTLIPEVLALIDGGTLTYDDVDIEKVISYEAPSSGTTVARTKFTLNLYTSEKDGNGDTLQYVKFSFLHCKGKPASYNLKDGQFFVPELSASSRPKKGESPVKLEFIDSLPTL